MSLFSDTILIHGQARDSVIASGPKIGVQSGIVIICVTGGEPAFNIIPKARRAEENQAGGQWPAHVSRVAGNCSSRLVIVGVRGSFKVKVCGMSQLG
jgi:hypothetical protein